MKFQYLIVEKNRTGYTSDNLKWSDKTFDEYGEEEWELCAIDKDFYYFKRTI